MQNKKDWIKTKLRENKFDKQEVYSLFPLFQKDLNADNWGEDSYRRQVRTCYAELIADEELDSDVLNDDLVKLEAQNQKKADTNTYYKRVNRNLFRETNTLEEMYKQFIDLIPKVDTSKINIKTDKTLKSNRIGLMQLSDVHVNTIVYPEENEGKEYNIEVCSKRLKKYTKLCIEQFKKEKVNKVYIILDGDMISSMRREDERMCSMTSTSLSTILLTHIIKQMILELVSNGFEVFVTGIIGNESRNSMDMPNGLVNSSDNWDFMILNILSMLFKDSKVVHVLIGNNPLRTVIQIPLNKKNNFTILIAHGHTLKKPTEDSYLKFTKGYELQGQYIDLTLCGHFHHFLQFPRIIFNGSVIGDTSYSKTLGFVCKASQNCLIINEDKSYYCYPIDLDDVSDIKKGYSYDEIYEPYAYMMRTPNETKKITIEMF